MENPGCYRLFRDGDRWIATGPAFVSLAASPVGYGNTYQEAIENLLSKPAFEAWLRASGQSRPSLADFVVNDCRPPENLPRDAAIAEMVRGEVGNVVPLPTRKRAKRAS
jgi:hypothetical protein